MVMMVPLQPSPLSSTYLVFASENQSFIHHHDQLLLTLLSSLHIITES